MQISQIHIIQPNFGWEGPKALEVSKLGSMREVEKKVGEVGTSLVSKSVSIFYKGDIGKSRCLQDT